PVIDHIVLLFLACCFILFSYSSSSLPPSSCLYPFSLHDALPIYSCRQMTSVKLSGDNITIGVSAFSECETLEKVEIIGNLTSVRSEEHTSELQSRFDLVCRLLLEKI